MKKKGLDFIIFIEFSTVRNVQLLSQLLCKRRVLILLIDMFVYILPASKGEKSCRFAEAVVGGRSQKETSLSPLLTTHPRPLAGWPRRRTHRPNPPSSLSSPPRSLRLLSNGVAGPSRLLSNRERHVGGDRAGASAQEVRIPGHKLPNVAPGYTSRQCSSGPPA